MTIINWREFYAVLGMLQLDAACDGARTEDGEGFNGYHTGKGKWLASKIRAERDLWPDDVEWIINAIPTYLNTQLNHIPKEYIEAEKNDMKAAAERAKAAWFAEKEKVAENLPSDYETCRGLMNQIDMSKVHPKDVTFLTNLRKWNGEHTEKQKPWVISLTHKYWNHDWDAGSMSVAMEASEASEASKELKELNEPVEAKEEMKDERF